MNERTKTGLEILQAAALLGLLGNILLRELPWGLNAFLFVTSFVTALAILIVRRKPEYWNRQTASLFGAMLSFGAMFLWRDSIELRTFDALAIIVILGVLMLLSLKVAPRIAGVLHYAVGLIWSGLNSMFSPAVLLSTDVDWKSFPKVGWTRHLIAVVRGLVIALPLVLVFGALFMAADAVYQGMIEQVFNVMPETVFTHVLLTAIFFWLSAGYLRGLLLTGVAGIPVPKPAQTSNTSIFEQVKKEDIASPDALPDNVTVLEHINRSDPPNLEIAPSEPDKKPRQWEDFDNALVPQAFTLGAVETSIILGLVNLLFLSFVIVQIPYLFGGMELVQNTPDFKLAEYARRGFGELVAVAALVLPMLLISHWLLRKDGTANEKIYRVLAGIQIALLFVIMTSAAQRLVLLTGSLGYGMTTVRLYPMIFMIWLAIVFVWFAITVLRGVRQHFAWGALWSALFILAATHVLNPDEFIVRTNVRLMQEGRSFDIEYNSNLSHDATPALVGAYDLMNKSDQCVVKERLMFATINASDDLRTWNWSRSEARALAIEKLEAVGPRLNGCPSPVGIPYMP